MRFGYWLPVFGGWLRNVDEEEGMSATWEYASRLARRSEALGFDLTLVAELNLNDIKGTQYEEMERFAQEVMPLVRARQGFSPACASASSPVTFLT